MAKDVKYQVYQRDDRYKTQKKCYIDKVTCLCQMIGYIVFGLKESDTEDEHTETGWRSY